MIAQTGGPPNTHQDNTSRPDTKRTFLISIIASIIASFVFVIFLQPIFGFISDAVVTVISLFYHGYVNTLYDQASLGIANAMIFWILSTVLIFMFSCMLSLVLIFVNFQYMVMIFTSLIKMIGFTERDQERLESSDDTLSLRSPSKLVSFTMVIGFLTFMSIILDISGSFVSLQATATFDRRLMALTPLISDQERKTLLGQWALMKGRKDYDKLNDKFEELAKKYQAELPKPLI